MNQAQLAAIIDHTLLRADATREQVETTCWEAREFGFAALCVNPVHVHHAAKLLKGCPTRVGTVVGFPLGATLTAVKAFEAAEACRAGAGEIDMVINVGYLKSGDTAAVREDIRAVVKAAREVNPGNLVKVIIETGYLSQEEKVLACRLAEEAGADLVKTSTGFGPGGATPEDVALMRAAVSPRVGVKASGGIRSLSQVLRLVEAGATRIGTSAALSILHEISGA